MLSKPFLKLMKTSVVFKFCSLTPSRRSLVWAKVWAVVDIPGKLKSPFLGIGIMSLSPSCVSFSLLIRILLPKLIIISLISHNFSKLGLMLSGPVALFSLICFLTFSYSDLVKGRALIFNSFPSRMVLIFSFSFIIFGGLPNSPLK